MLDTSTLEAHDVVAVGEEPRHLGRGYPAPADLLEILVARPTGDGAALSDEDGDRMVAQLGEQVARRRDAHAFERPDRIADQQLGGVAAQDDRRLLADLDRPVGREVQRDRGPRGVGCAGADEVDGTLPLWRTRTRARAGVLSWTPRPPRGGQ